jgi:ectoine hydroxylase-related dioxygenase (phytanoyl-CoA dioxygenase family)
MRGILAERGCDLERTYFDVPRLRTAFPSDYLSSGIAYAFHPHRDTWYSAPFSQVNWWMPVYDVCADNIMAFHPKYWDSAVRNSSDSYNYYEWNRTSRQNAAQHVKADTRVQPRAQVPVEQNPQLRVVASVGGAMLFSAAQLHSTVPNTSGITRYSIDFRTVHLDDVLGKRGAPNVDSASTGTTMGDYMRGTDLAHLPESAMALYLDGTESEHARPPSA